MKQPEGMDDKEFAAVRRRIEEAANAATRNIERMATAAGADSRDMVASRSKPRIAADDAPTDSKGNPIVCICATCHIPLSDWPVGPLSTTKSTLAIWVFVAWIGFAVGVLAAAVAAEASDTPAGSIHASSMLVFAAILFGIALIVTSIASLQRGRSCPHCDAATIIPITSPRARRIVAEYTAAP